MKSKQQFRKHFKNLRNQLFNDFGTQVAKHLEQKATELIKVFPSKCIAGYSPFDSEVDCMPLMDALHLKGLRLCLPETPELGKPLTFRFWKPRDKLQKGRYGINEPLPSSSIAFPDLILVPLLAFDKKGNRLGYGGGYYDRTLALLRLYRKKTIAVGLAFENQKCNKLPFDSYDARLDAILHSKGIIHFS